MLRLVFRAAVSLVVIADFCPTAFGVVVFNAAVFEFAFFGAPEVGVAFFRAAELDVMAPLAPTTPFPVKTPACVVATTAGLP